LIFGISVFRLIIAVNLILLGRDWKAAKAARAKLKQFALYLNEQEAEDQEEFFDKALKDFDEALGR